MKKQIKKVRIVQSKSYSGESIWTPIITRGGKLIEAMKSEKNLNAAYANAKREHCGFDDEVEMPEIEYFDGPVFDSSGVMINEPMRLSRGVPMAFPVAWLYAATAGIVVVCVLVALFGFK